MGQFGLQGLYLRRIFHILGVRHFLKLEQVALELPDLCAQIIARGWQYTRWFRLFHEFDF